MPISVYQCIDNPLYLAPHAPAVLTLSRNPCSTHCAVALFAIHYHNLCKPPAVQGDLPHLWLRAFVLPAKKYMIFALIWQPFIYLFVDYLFLCIRVFFSCLHVADALIIIGKVTGDLMNHLLASRLHL